MPSELFILNDPNQVYDAGLPPAADVANLSGEESLALIAREVIRNLRDERNRRIAETDWWVLPDRTPTQAQLAYRQALRDITNTYTSLDDVVWPEKPE